MGPIVEVTTVRFGREVINVLFFVKTKLETRVI